MYFDSRKAIAKVFGSDEYPNINGTVEFIDVPGGTRINVFIKGLPKYKAGYNSKSPIGPHGFHIHEDGICNSNPNKPFSEAGEHYNPDNQPHGNHAGDLPVLFSNDGIASMSFYTNRFKTNDILNKAIIIHENPDDYRTMPSGNSGKRIACGIIRSI